MVLIYLLTQYCSQLASVEWVELKAPIKKTAFNTYSLQIQRMPIITQLTKIGHWSRIFLGLFDFEMSGYVITLRLIS